MPRKATSPGWSLMNVVCGCFLLGKGLLWYRLTFSTGVLMHFHISILHYYVYYLKLYNNPKKHPIVVKSSSSKKIDPKLSTRMPPLAWPHSYISGHPVLRCKRRITGFLQVWTWTVFGGKPQGTLEYCTVRHICQASLSVKASLTQ